MPSDIDGARSAVRAYRYTLSRFAAWTSIATSLVGIVASTAASSILGRGLGLAWVVAGTIGAAAAGILLLLRLRAPPVAQPIPLKTARTPASEWSRVLQARNRRAETVGTLLLTGGSALVVLVILMALVPRNPCLVGLVGSAYILWLWTALHIVQASSRLYIDRLLGHGPVQRLVPWLRWAPTGPAYALRARAFAALRAHETSDELLDRMVRHRRPLGATDLAACYAAAFRSDVRVSASGFTNLHHARPASPYGAMGLSDALLAERIPAPSAARHVLSLFSTRVWHPRFVLYAQANLARSYALSGDADTATSMANEVEQAIADAPARRKAAVLHRLACAWRDMDAERADDLLTQASELDPHGDVGHRARQGLAPAPEWP